MKILKRGKNPDEEPKKAPWIGKKLTCWHCETEFQLTTQDSKKVKERTNIEGTKLNRWYVNCPVCKSTIEF